MQPMELLTPETAIKVVHPNLHTTEHVESHNTGDSIIYGAKICVACFIILGLFIGYNRTPGSFYTYGLSCFVWPMISCIALGAIVGGALGFVFGAIAHASDPVNAGPDQSAPQLPMKAAKNPAFHLTLRHHH